MTRTMSAPPQVRRTTKALKSERANPQSPGRKNDPWPDAAPRAITALEAARRYHSIADAAVEAAHRRRREARESARAAYADLQRAQAAFERAQLEEGDADEEFERAQMQREDAWRFLRRAEAGAVIALNAPSLFDGTDTDGTGTQEGDEGDANDEEQSMFSAFSTMFSSSRSGGTGGDWPSGESVCVSYEAVSTDVSSRSSVTANTADPGTLVSVRGAGVVHANGVYIQQHDNGASPLYYKEGPPITMDEGKVFHMCIIQIDCPDCANHIVWFLARVPVDPSFTSIRYSDCYYYCRLPRDNLYGEVPPKFGWKVPRTSIRPAPVVTPYRDPDDPSKCSF